MKKNIIQKGLVLGIILLFFGASISLQAATNSDFLRIHHWVKGFVKYSDASNVPNGVFVTITDIDNGNSMTVETQQTNNGTGFYLVNIQDLNSNDGDTIFVNVSYGGCEGNNSIIVDDASGSSQWCNVTIYGNLPPSPPNQPIGPSEIYVYQSDNFSINASYDPELENISYGWDWDGNGIVDEWTEYLPSGQNYTMSHVWNFPGVYQVRNRAKDVHGAESGVLWSNPLNISVLAHQPTQPNQPTGPTTGFYNTHYNFTTSSTDPNDFPLYYSFNWSDGTIDTTPHIIRYDDDEMNKNMTLQYTQDINFAQKSINISKAILNGSVSAKLWIYGKRLSSHQYLRIRINGEDIIFDGLVFDNNIFSWQSFDIDTDLLNSWVNTFYLRRRSGDIGLSIGIDNDTVEGMSRWRLDYGPIYTDGELMIYLQINSTFFGPYNSNENCTLSHLWSSPGVYDITAKARNDWTESEWSPVLSVNILSNPPYIPSNPNPQNNSINNNIYTVLTWDGGDPDGDPVTYDVYFGTTTSPPKVSSNQTSTAYNPGTLLHGTTYYWKIVAWDIYNATATGPMWSFNTKSNNPPYEPHTPTPEDGAVDVDIDQVLSWTCSDPDGHSLTYDVYFEADDSTPDVLVSDDQTGTTYNPGTLDYETTYYWQIIAEDEFGAVTDGPIWEFTTRESIPDLDCYGELSWVDVTTGETVTGSFTVENTGEPLSMLDWEIIEWPDWGTWFFNPESGTGLEEGDTVTIDVEVVAPDEQEETFTGEIKIINSENSSDFCIIDVSLATPVNQQVINPLLQMILERFPNAFPILRQVLGL